MTAVVIGVDPAKRSNTIEVIDSDENVLLVARFENTSGDYRKMRALVKRWPERRWAVEGATGVGLNLAQRLVSDGERVVDVPSKLSTRVRAIDTGHGRKNDPTDAHAVAVVGLRTVGLREVTVDDEAVVMRLLSQRRRDLVRSRTQAVNRLHQALMQLIPAGARKKLTVDKAKTLLAAIRPRDAAGKARRQLAADLIDDVAVLDRKLVAVDKRIAQAVKESTTTLTDIVGVGPVTAAAILGEVGDVARFTTADRFASYTGTAPLEVSSGDVVRHRLSRAGNRRLNNALHIVALSNKRHDPRGKAYYQRKLAAGKGKKGSLRCLKRRLSDVIFRTLVEDRARANPGGQMGATLTASAVDQIPKANTSDKPQPGFITEATPTAPPRDSGLLTQRGTVIVGPVPSLRATEEARPAGPDTPWPPVISISWRIGVRGPGGVAPSPTPATAGIAAAAPCRRRIRACRARPWPAGAAILEESSPEMEPRDGAR